MIRKLLYLVTLLVLVSAALYAQAGAGAFSVGSDYSVAGAWTFTGTVPAITNLGGAIVGTTATQTLTLKTLTSPTINTATIASPTLSGTIVDTAIHPFPEQHNAAAGALGAVTELISTHAPADNTATDFFTVTVPLAVAGGAIDLYVGSMLSDGDSTDSARYSIGISRVTGSVAAKATISSKSVVGATAGAGANAVITATVTGMTGATSGPQTFTVQIKNARSAGAATNHPIVAIAKLVNLAAAGITIAGA